MSAIYPTPAHSDLADGRKGEHATFAHPRERTRDPLIDHPRPRLRPAAAICRCSHTAAATPLSPHGPALAACTLTMPHYCCPATAITPPCSYCHADATGLPTPHCCRCHTAAAATLLLPHCGCSTASCSPTPHPPLPCPPMTRPLLLPHPPPPRLPQPHPPLYRPPPPRRHRATPPLPPGRSRHLTRRCLARPRDPPPAHRPPQP